MLSIKPILSTLLRHKSSTLLIVIQIAITFAVVVNSISIIQQRISLMDRISGIQEDQLVTFNISTFGANENQELNYKEDLRLLRSLPEVLDAIIVNQVPLSGSGDAAGFASSQQDFDNLNLISAGVFHSDSHFINTMGLELIEGRNFNDDEVVFTDAVPKLQALIITKSLAEKLFPDSSAIGKPIFFWGIGVTVVGVVKQMSGSHVNSTRINENVIMPLQSLRNFHRVIIKTKPESRAKILSQVEEILIKRNPNRVVHYLRTLEEIKQRSYSGDAAMTKILSVVSLLLVIITALGIVGIVSFNINQRIKQIGTRRALGARKIDILHYFLTENFIVTFVGVMFGSVICILLNSYLVTSFSLLPIDWKYIPGGLVIMLLTGMLSVWLPAKRASEISPAIATQSI